jgi:hypothetical protein
VRSGYPGRGTDAGQQLGHRPRLTVADDQGPPGRDLHPVEAATSAATALSVKVLSISAAPVPTSTSRPVRARSTIRPMSCWSPGPDQVRADRGDGQVRVVGGQGELLGGGLAARVRPAGPGGIGRTGARSDQGGPGVRDRG